MSKTIWLIGAGNMAAEYAKVLAALKIQPVVIGRGEESAEIFRQKTGLGVTCGGLEAFLQTGPEKPEAVIIAVSAVELACTAARMLDYCQPKILLEKPGALTTAELDLLKSCKGGRQLCLAYNRRFFASTEAVRGMLEEDGGPVSCTFEFTEWAHRIALVIDRKHPEEMKHWLIANSSHVIDLAFHLAGHPASLHATVAGALPWHPSGSVFCGAGLTERGATFCYHANWQAPGRWGVEVMSEKRRFRMCPLETVQVQNKGETSWSEVGLDDALDQRFKPGLFKMTSAFLAPEPGPTLCRLDELARHFPKFQAIAGYRD